MATIDTNMRCLESISQHLDVADVTPDDIQTIQGEFSCININNRALNV